MYLKNIYIYQRKPVGAVFLILKIPASFTLPRPTFEMQGGKKQKEGMINKEENPCLDDDFTS